MNMKKILLAAAAVVALSGTAFAAEGGMQAYNPAAVGTPPGFANGTLLHNQRVAQARYFDAQGRALAAHQTNPGVATNTQSQQTGG
jgi:hypothetical protein